MLIIKNQQIEYLNKIVLITILSMFFVFFSYIFFSTADNYKKTFFNGMSDQIIILRNNRVREPYEQDDIAGAIVTPPNRLYWGLEDVESIQRIDGVEAVYLGEENTSFVADSKGNTYTKTFNFSDYKNLFKSSIAINTAPEKITLSLEGVSISEDVYKYYQGGNTRGLEIIYGEYPKDGTDQMLIPDFVAEYMKESNGYEKISDVIGEEIQLEGKDDNEENTSLSYQVSGVYNSQSNKSITSDYKLYTGYRNEDLEKRAVQFTSDFYESDKAIYQQQGQTYKDYYESTYSNIENYSKASGYFYAQMYVVTDEDKTEDVISRINEYYPNNIIESQYTYKNDKQLSGDTFDKIRKSRIIFMTVSLFVFSIIIFIVQKSYYLSKRKDYAGLYSLGIQKKQILKIMIFESSIDVFVIILSISIVTWLLHFVPIRVFANLFYYVFNLKSISTIIVFLILLHMLIILVNLKRLKYNKINKILS